MTRINRKHVRILAIAPTTKGFGYAVLEGSEELVDWGVKVIQGNRNREALAKAKEMIAHYEPRILVLEDTSAKNARRAPRIRALTSKIRALARSQKLRVAMFSQKQIRHAFFPDGKATKHSLAEIMTQRFPEELGSRLPPKRRAWMREDSRMSIFDAVALAQMVQKPNKSPQQETAVGNTEDQVSLNVAD